MCNIALHWTAHITTVQCNNLFIHSDLVSLAVCTLTVATCMHPYTAKFPFLHIIFQYIFCMYFYSKMVKFCEQINFHDISVFFQYSSDVLQTRSQCSFFLCVSFWFQIGQTMYLQPLQYTTWQVAKNIVHRVVGMVYIVADIRSTEVTGS